MVFKNKAPLTSEALFLLSDAIHRANKFLVGIDSTTGH